MLTIVTALLCEAKPVISRYKLKKIPGTHPYQIFQNNDLSLIISGVGKAASASATGYVHAIKASPSYSAWLNIGMAGHSKLEIGSGFLANKIHDRSTDQTWFPPKVFEPPCITDKLMTVDRPESKYEFGGGVDMEASGFYSTACRFTTSELVQSYKIVSDNPRSPVRKFSTNEASDLIDRKIEDIIFFIEQLLNDSHELCGINETPILFDQIKNQIKMTHSEQLLIRERLKKLQLLNPDALADFSETPESAKVVLKSLDQIIKQQKILF